MKLHFLPFVLFALFRTSAQASFNGQAALDGGRRSISADLTTTTTTADDRILPATLSEELLSLHKSLVEIESISENELEVGIWLASYLKSKGFSVERQKVEEKRYNVYAWTGGKGEAKVLVSSHIDTVPPFLPYKRFDNGTLFGRGSVDAKASVASQIVAVLSVLDSYKSSSVSSSKSSSPPPVALLFVVDEEAGGEGMKFFSSSPLNRKDYDAVIFGEPTEGQLCGGHKGITLVRIQVQGQAAHSGYPWLGLSANDVLVEALSRIKYLEAHPGKDGLPSSEKYGNTTVNVGQISGGLANNVVAESATASMAIRIAATNPQNIVRIINETLVPVKEYAASKGGRLDVLWSGAGYGPVDMDCDVEELGCITVNYGTDVPNLEVSESTKRYLYGPGTILVAHGAREALTIKQLETAVVDYRKLLLKAFGEQDAALDRLEL